MKTHVTRLPSLVMPALAAVCGRAARAPAVIAAVALCATTAVSRTVSVSSVSSTSASLAFGDADGADYTLAWGYGATDGGSATNAWDTFKVLGSVAAGDTSRTVALPAGWGSAVSHARFFLLEPEIPADATRVEYLQSSGSQWIDTDVRGKVGVEAEIKVACVTMDDNTILGCRKDSGNTRFFPVHWANYKWWKGWLRNDGNSSYWSSSDDIVINTPYTVRATFKSGEQKLVVNGMVKGTPMSESSSFDSGLDMYLFAANMYGSAGQQAKARIYSAKIWLDDDLKREFVPCLDPDDAPAMYDRVEKKYFYNGGSGDPFATGGPLATPIIVTASTVSVSAAEYGEPDEYLDYIEATGEQYIDTGVNAATGLKVRADFSWEDSISTGTDWALVGAHNGAANPNGVRMLMVHMYNQKPFVGYGKDSRGNPANASSFTSGVRCEVVADFSDSSALELYQNGSRTFNAANVATYAAHGNIDIGIPLYIFAYNYAGTAAEKSKAKLYELKILRADGNGGFDVVRHYLPARKGGVVGLYDKATGKFSGSATATPFRGPDAALPRPAKTLAWVQSDGDNGSRRLWLDTGVIAKSGIRSDIDFTLKDEPTSSNERGILSARGAANSNTRFYLAYHYHGNFIYGYKTFFDSSVAATKDCRYRIVGALDEGAQSVKVNDAELNSGASTSTGYLNATNTLALFCYRDSTGTSYHSAIRLYSLKLWDGDEALRDYVPCIADNGQAGLYDRVTERVFFPVAKNAGATSAFYLDSEVGVAETETVSAITVDWTYGAMLLGAQIAASGVLDLVNVPADAKLGGATIPVTLHQTTGAANFGTWTLRVNGVASDYRLYWNGSALRIPGALVLSVW